MTLRTLGQSDLRITPIGIGAWAIGGGKWEFAWGPQDDEESIAAIHAGLDHGINWIDTAAVYGLGHSETVVGRAIKGLRNAPYIFTKCSLVWDESGKISHNLQAASIRREAEASLEGWKSTPSTSIKSTGPPGRAIPRACLARIDRRGGWSAGETQGRREDPATLGSRISMRSKCSAPASGSHYIAPAPIFPTRVGDRDFNPSFR